MLMGAKRCVSLFLFVLCRVALGYTACPGPGTPGTPDVSSLLQVVEPEKEAKPAPTQPTQSAKLEPHKAAAAPASTKHAHEPGKGKVVATTVTKQTPPKDPSETMLQSMLDAFGNYLNRLLFG